MQRWFYSLAVPALVISLLYLGRSVLVPLAVALLLAVMLSPGVERLENFGVGRFGLGRIASVLIVSAGVATVFLGVGWLLGTQGRALLGDVPEYRRVLIGKLHDLREPIDTIERVAREMRAAAGVSEPAPARVEVVNGDSPLLGQITSWAGSLVSLLGTAGLVVVLLIFLLIEREDLRNRLIRVAGQSNMRLATTTFGDATERVTKYVRALALVNFGHGLAVGMGLWLVGLPGALLFGLLSALLRFVPYVGPWVAAALPIALSVAVFDTWTMPLVIVGFFAVIELLSNNVLEPVVYGASVGLSPFGVILSAIFWAWLWGPIGLVLATPLTVCLVVIGRHVPRLAGLSILLSDAEPLRPAERLYQRLLARDVGESLDLVEEHTEKLGALQAWDEIVLPALCLLDRDQQSRLLQDDELECAREVLEVVISDLQDAQVVDSSDRSRAIQCLPARAWGDELACRAFAQLLETSGTPALARGRVLTAELVEGVQQSGAPAACIWSLDPFSTGALRHLVIRLRRQCPQIEIVIGTCGDASARPLLGDRLADDKRIHVANSFAGARERLLGIVS